MAFLKLPRWTLGGLLTLPLALNVACGKADSTGPSSDGKDDESSGGSASDDGEGTGGNNLGGAGPAAGGTEAPSTGGDEGAGGSELAMGGDESQGLPPHVGDAGFIHQVTFNDEGQLDLLFVIDNSVSMADKQQLLVRAVPQLVQRLTNPDCVDNETHNKSPNPGICPAGSTQEARAFDDMHIGIISSSLGGHGSPQCEREYVDENGTPHNFDDRGRLVPTLREMGADVEGTGFLSWNGEGDSYTRVSLTAAFTDQLSVVGERGCGFEAPLEAWYRFLVDPQPPEEIVLNGTRAESTGVDEVLLAQREAFLRPESWVAIVVLTDENDCSAMEGGTYYNNASYGWLVTDAARPMRVATEVCDTNPNDPCCLSCLQAVQPPEGCEEAVSICEESDQLSPDMDRANVRCFDNQRRFGLDLLYPTDRYVDALSQRRIIDARDGEEVDNPLLMGAGLHQGIERDPGMVFFAGIVGVPWQDLASPQSLLENSPRLDYLTAVQLAEKNVDVDGTMVDRWQLMLGDPGRHPASQHCKDNPDDPTCGAVGTPPLDPFMIESIEERTIGATNPITGDAIVASTSNDPLANAINGHEFNNVLIDPRFPDGGPARDDLQYACIFELETPNLDCTADSASCDCGDEPLRNRSVCQAPSGGAASNSQYYARAYPGTRILKVLRDFGENSIVGSICPKFATGDSTDLSFGYNPVLQQLVDRVHVWQAGSCFPTELPIDPADGGLQCAIVEARSSSDGGLNCGAPGRVTTSTALRAVAIDRLVVDGLCDGETGVDCADFDTCAIDELSGAARQKCLYDAVDTSEIEPGYCYIDPALTLVDEDGETIYPAGGSAAEENAIVENCGADDRRMLRFSGVNTPAAGASVYVICDSSTVN